VLVPPTRAQVYRRRRLIVFGAAGALLVAGSYLPMTLFAPLDAATATVAEVAPPPTVPADLAWPSSTAIGVGAIGVPGVLASTGSSDVLPMASISKIITALTVLEHHPITLDDHGPSIEYTAKDVAYFAIFQSRGATVKPMTAGTVVTQYQAMQAMLLPSASNYTHALTDWAFGSEAAFVEAANAWLTENGFTQTTFVEPTGLDPRNSSTVAELIELGKIALADPVLAEIVATPAVDLPGAGILENSNEILGTYGIDGIKTGTLPQAGACLLFSSDFEVGSHTVTIVGVALGGVLHDVQYPQIQALVQSVQAGFREVTLVESGQPFAEYVTEWGDSSTAVALETASALVWSDTPISLEVRSDSFVTAGADQQVGTLEYSVGTELIEVPLVLDSPIEDPGPLWRLGNPSLVFG
jgi:D-alanyl-D-alanine carboxypeptidase (penicillin-binding protein 5/6)